jgi:hypothetical protein
MPTTDKPEFYYRVFAGVSEIDQPPVHLTDLGRVENETHLYVDKLRVLRHTDMGVWLKSHKGKEVWVHANPIQKAYAYKTYALALNSFKIRLTNRISILDQQLIQCRFIKKCLTEGPFERRYLLDGGVTSTYSMEDLE